MINLLSSLILAIVLAGVLIVYMFILLENIDKWVMGTKKSKYEKLLKEIKRLKK